MAIQSASGRKKVGVKEQNKAKKKNTKHELKWTNAGVVDKRVRKAPERAFTDGCRVGKCGVWLSYGLAEACVGWADTRRERNLGKKVVHSKGLKKHITSD